MEYDFKEQDQGRRPKHLEPVHKFLQFQTMQCFVVFFYPVLSTCGHIVFRTVWTIEDFNSLYCMLMKGIVQQNDYITQTDHYRNPFCNE